MQRIAGEGYFSIYLNSIMASNMLMLWGSGSAFCWRPMIVLEEKGLQGYGQKLLSFATQEYLGEENMKLNPRGQIPSFRDGDVVVNESGAICQYLEYKYRNQGTRLLPEDPAQYAQVLQLMYETENVNRMIMYDIIRYTFKTKREHIDQNLLKRRKEEGREELKRWEAHLAKQGPNGYLAGKDFSMADVFFYPFLAVCVRSKLKLAAFPCLKSYYERLTQRPSIQASWPPHWKDSEGNNFCEGI